MPFTPEQTEALKELLKETLKDPELLSELLEPTVKTQITENSARFARELKALAAQQTDIDTRLKAVPSYSDEFFTDKFTALIDEYAANQPDDEDDDTAKPNSDVDKLRYEFEQRQKQFEETSLKEKQAILARFEALQRDKEAAEADRIKAEKQSRISAAQAEAIKSISGQVISGKESRLFSALLAEGKIVYDDETNAYGIKGKDQFGIQDVFTPISVTAIAPIIQSDFSEYVAPRSGGGTGASPAKSQHPAPFRDVNEISAEELYAMPFEQRMALLGAETA